MHGSGADRISVSIIDKNPCVLRLKSLRLNRLLTRTGLQTVISILTKIMSHSLLIIQYEDLSVVCSQLARDKQS